MPRGVARPDRGLDYVVDRRPGFLDGRPGVSRTGDGRMLPDVPVCRCAGVPYRVGGEAAIAPE